jgi:hypothetical protein
MNKTILSFLLALTAITQAQTTFFDTVNIAAQYKNAVYYKLSDGNKVSTANTDWHLAFSVQKVQFPLNTLPSVTIRYNGANGVNLFQKAFNDTAFFTADTSGFATFTKLYDSDSNLDTGSFNNGLNISQFDYGWGVYNTTTKNIPGRSVYFLQLNSGIKKLRIVELVYDTLWQIQYANLDNSNLQTVSIPKRLYQGKLFAYLNLETNAVSDKEPNSSDWDLLFHKYNARDVVGFDVYPSVGVWSNKGVEVAKAAHFDVSSNDFSGFIFSKKMNEIGRDWKEYQAPNWILQDSLAYFVKDKGGSIFKIVFTAFEGSSTGKIIFSKTILQTSSIAEINSARLACFPNPASNLLNIVADNVAEDATFLLTDLAGKEIIKTALGNEVFQTFKVDLSNVTNGFYIASIEQNGTKIQQRVVVSK